MKKAIIAICAAAAATIITTGAIFSSATVAEKKSVGSEKALEIALSDAGISRESVIKSSSEFDKEKGRYVFDVDFDCGGKEYDYTIDAKSGEIIDRDVRNETDGKTETTAKAESTTKASAQNSTQGSAAQLISLAKAKSIALKNAKIDSSDAKFIKGKLDRDDGRYEYEIEFISGGKEYEYTIDAKSGKVLEKSVETVNEPTTKPTAAASENGSKLISLAKAKSIALKNAKIDSSNAKFVKGKLDRDDGRYEYEIEFISGGKEYEYAIDAKSGKILEKDVETVNEPTTKPTAASTENSSKLISLAKAKSIALKNAKIDSSNAKFVKGKLDKDDGRYEYEIEFISGGKEYEYTIDAKSGKILENSVERADEVPTTKKTESATSALISVDKAKSIALNHAGLKASEVVIEKIKLEKDDGIYEYEVEFKKGNWEYEYSINAKTGAIIEFDKDYDD